MGVPVRLNQLKGNKYIIVQTKCLLKEKDEKERNKEFR